MTKNKINWPQLLERESARVEWKEKVYKEENVVRTLCAFANDIRQVGGGRVICGIKEEKNDRGEPVPTVIGLDSKRIKQLREHVLSICRDKVEPPLTPTVAEYPLDGDPSLRVLCFEVTASPYAHRYKTSDKSVHYYVRVNDRTQRANGLIPRLMELKKIWPPFLDQPCPGAQIEDVDLLALKQFLGKINPPLPVEEYLEPGTKLRGDILDMVTIPPGGAEEKKPRNFTLLLFGSEPHRFFRGASAIFSVYPGTDRGTHRSRRHELFGPIPQLVKELMDHLQLYMGLEIDKSADFLSGQQNRRNYSPDAVRETIVNAFVHRDYHSHEPVRVTVFEDRIEVTSPGGIHENVDIKRFREGKAPPYWRNPSLSWFMVALGFAQNEGQGIRMIIDETQKSSGKKPLFDVQKSSVIVTIPAYRPEAEALEKTSKNGRQFQAEVAEIYRKLGFGVEFGTLIGGHRVDLVLRQRTGLIDFPVIAECIVGRVNLDKMNKFVARLNSARMQNPGFQGVIISKTGFAPPVKEAARSLGVICILYSDLLRSLRDGELPKSKTVSVIW